jgi:hypothetical protein
VLRPGGVLLVGLVPDHPDSGHDPAQRQAEKPVLLGGWISHRLAIPVLDQWPAGPDQFFQIGYLISHQHRRPEHLQVTTGQRVLT